MSLKRAQKDKGTHTAFLRKKQYLYPQPLMHIRLSIFFESLVGKQKAADKAEFN